jgi:hypothetical protein
MHRFKIFPTTLLILSLINFLLAAPVVLQEARQESVNMAYVPKDVMVPISKPEKRSDEIENPRDKRPDEPQQKRGPSPGSNPAPSVGALPANQDAKLATYSPFSTSPQMGTSTLQDAAPSPVIKQPPSGENSPSSHGYTGMMSSENGLTSEGSGSSKGYSSWDSSANSATPEAGSKQGAVSGSWSIKNPPSNRPETVSTTNSMPLWDPHDWSDSSSEAEAEKNFMSKTKIFFDKLVYKFKFWPGR